MPSPPRPRDCLSLRHSPAGNKAAPLPTVNQQLELAGVGLGGEYAWRHAGIAGGALTSLHSASLYLSALHQPAANPAAVAAEGAAAQLALSDAGLTGAPMYDEPSLLECILCER